MEKVNRKTVFLDTNAVLRFLMQNDEEMYKQVAKLLIANDCVAAVEVIAEAVYNLQKKYKLTRQAIAERLKDFSTLQEDLLLEETVVLYACNLFAASNFDFVDCLLDGYAKINGNPVFTFDGDLKKQLGSKLFNGYD
jgi:predicted nucleic acid-binding protein